MAAKNLKEMIESLNIKNRIQELICVGPTSELVQRIDNTTASLEKTIENELRDFLSHEVMRMQSEALREETKSPRQSEEVLKVYGAIEKYNVLEEFFNRIFTKTGDTK